MKILLCGKGGSGKSTVASLLAKNLQSKGYRILIVDADESNYGLNAQLGLKAPKELMDQIGGKKAVFKRMGQARSIGKKTSLFSEKWRIDDIPADYVSKKDNIYLLQIGKVKHFGEGCACPMGGLSKDFLQNIQLQPTDIAIIDTEAGVEHLGRGIAHNVDMVIAILDPSYESIQLSKKIGYMSKEGGKKAYFVLNKVDEVLANKIASKVDEEQIIGNIPFNGDIQEKGLNGEVLDINIPQIENITNFVIQKIKNKIQVRRDI